MFVRWYEKKRDFRVLFPAAGLQENQGGTSVTELPRDGGVALGDGVHPWRVFLRKLYGLSRQKVRSQPGHRADGLWGLLRVAPEGVAHLQCHGQAFSWQL